MAKFPAFINIKGKKCTVIGGGKVAARKIETLLKFGPRITVVSPAACDEIKKLKDENKVVLIKKRYSEEDLEGAFLVIAATDDSAVNAKIHADAQKNNLLVNVADDPEKCTFIFPSVVVRDELVVGITTSGNFPALSKKVRERIEEVLPQYYSDRLKDLKAWRIRAEKEITDAGTRKELINRVLDEVLFYEDAVTDKQLFERVEKIFEEYKHEENH